MSNKAIIGALSSLGLLAVAMPSYAAEVTYERLLNSAQAEPQNWLMVHRDYNNSRHSALKEINRDNVKDLKLKFLVSIGGRSTGGTLRGKEESTPLVDDGFMYVADTWTRVTKRPQLKPSAQAPWTRTTDGVIPVFAPLDPAIPTNTGTTIRATTTNGMIVFISVYSHRW